MEAKKKEQSPEKSFSTSRRCCVHLTFGLALGVLCSVLSVSPLFLPLQKNNCPIIRTLVFCELNQRQDLFETIIR